MSLLPFGSAPTTLSETIGTKLRRLAQNAKTTNPWLESKLYMKAVPAWQPSTAYSVQMVVVNGGYLYSCNTAGTSNSTGGPTGHDTSALQTDNTVKWQWLGVNVVTTDPSISQPAWAQSTSYTLGNQILANGNIYACVVAGTSSDSGNGPSAGIGGNAIVDGTATWTYLGANRVNQYAGDIPTVSSSAGTPPAGLTNIYYPGGNNSTSATGFTNQGMTITGVGIVAGGYNYAIGDTITFLNRDAGNTELTAPGYIAKNAGGANYAIGDTGYINGGTYTRQAQYIVTNVSGGAVTAIALLECGVYTVNPGTTGVATTVITGSGDGNLTVNLRNVQVGISPTPLVVTVTGVSNGAVTKISLTSSGVYTTLPGCGGNGIGCANTSGSGGGFMCNILSLQPAPYMLIRGAGTNGIYYSTPYQAYAGVFIPTAPGTTGYQNSHFAIEFCVDAPKFWVYNASYDMHVIIDGIRFSACAPSQFTGASTNFLQFDFTSAGGRKKRHIRFEFHNYPYIPCIGVDVASSVWAPDTQDDITACVISDSILTNNGYSALTPGYGFTHRLSHLLNWKNVYNMCIPGTGWINRGSARGVSTDNFAFRVSQAVALNSDVIFFMGSTNDSTTGLTTAVTSTLQTIRTLGSRAIIVVFGVLSLTGELAVENAVAAGVTAFADPLGLTYFVPIYNRTTDQPYIIGTWNNNPFPNGTYGSALANNTLYINQVDNVHPVDIGLEYIVTRIANDIKTYVLPNLK
jgi:hypothetical protein